MSLVEWRDGFVWIEGGIGLSGRSGNSMYWKKFTFSSLIVVGTVHGEQISQLKPIAYTDP